MFCKVCGKPITTRGYHWGHERRCPSYADDSVAYSCDCDVNYHPRCCPACNPETEEGMIRRCLVSLRNQERRLKRAGLNSTLKQVQEAIDELVRI